MSEREVTVTPRSWLVTDFDRLGVGLVGSRADADRKAAEIAEAYPGNTLHVLESVSCYRSEMPERKAFEVRLTDR